MVETIYVVEESEEDDGEEIVKVGLSPTWHMLSTNMFSQTVVKKSEMLFVRGKCS